MEEFEEGPMHNRSNFAMDLLSRFGCNGKNFPGNFEVKEEKDFEVDLTLGLSLNGKFGIDPRRGMMKESSFVVPGMMKPVKFEEEPVETTKEVLRKRKEDQSVRRMEAKRRRMEKTRTFRPAKDCDKVLPEAMKNCTKKGSPSTSKTPSGLQEQSDIESETNKPVMCNENQLPRLTTAKGEHQHSDLESEPTKTSHKNRSTVVSKEMVRHMLLKMTCVTTKVEGTNGNEIRGLLYPCKKGEEIKIVCICHGSFLSPAEFFKHAGGGDVENPLRHIVVNSSPIS